MSSPYNICADGSALKNGKPGAKGGYGVVCEFDRSHDRSGSFTDGRQTNNRYELEAIKQATEIAREVNNSSFNIISESEYALNSITVWSETWEKNGWITATGNPVQHQDLIKTIIQNVRDLRASGKDIVFKHTREHQSGFNNESDCLARKAANSNAKHIFVKFRLPLTQIFQYKLFFAYQTR